MNDSLLLIVLKCDEKLMKSWWKVDENSIELMN